MKIHKKFLKQYGLNLPKNNRYEVSGTENLNIAIFDKRINKTEYYNPAEFIQYQPLFNPKTNKFPSYVLQLASLTADIMQKNQHAKFIKVKDIKR